MFTIYQKSVGGRVTQRFFQEWGNAKDELQKDVEDAKSCKWLIVDTIDTFNPQKGIYNYKIMGFTSGAEIFSFSLIEACFED